MPIWSRLWKRPTITFSRRPYRAGKLRETTLKMVMMMKKRELSIEQEILESYEKGDLRSVSPGRSGLKKYREAARVTFIKDRRVNIRLTSPDLMDIQARAAEE